MGTCVVRGEYGRGFLGNCYKDGTSCYCYNGLTESQCADFMVGVTFGGHGCFGPPASEGGNADNNCCTVGANYYAQDNSCCCMTSQCLDEFNVDNSFFLCVATPRMQVPDQSTCCHAMTPGGVPLQYRQSFCESRGHCCARVSDGGFDCINLQMGETRPSQYSFCSLKIPLPGQDQLCQGIDDPACQPPDAGCCLCDRCCDGLTATQCTAKGGSVMRSGSCTTSTTQTACKNANVKPACRQGKWKLGKLPPEHWAGRVNPLQQGGRMEIVSTTGLKTKDKAAGSGSQFEECRQVYGWLQKSTTKNVMEGRICNTYNRNRVNCGNPALNANKSPTLNLVRSTTNGAMEFTGRFRIPCPESTDMGCATTVGCAA